jgi:hypothetical protein
VRVTERVGPAVAVLIIAVALLVVGVGLWWFAIHPMHGTGSTTTVITTSP